MQTILGIDIPQPLKWALALIFVLILVALLALLLRRISGGRMQIKGQGSNRARQPRLGIIDIYDLDRQRQLVLLRRDNVEHLVMIGGASDVVVETNIQRGAMRPSAAPVNDGAMTERLEGDTVYVPGPPAPVAVAAPASVTAPVVAGAAMALAPLAERRGEPAGSVAGAPSQSHGMTQEPAVLAAPASSAGPVASGPAVTTPVASGAVAPTPAPAAEPRSKPAAATADAALPAFPFAVTPAPQPPAADLDDMTRQLEQALARPFAAVRAASSQGQSAPPPAPVSDSPAIDTPVAPTPAPTGISTNRFEELMGEQLRDIARSTPAAAPAPEGKPHLAELENILATAPDRPVSGGTMPAQATADLQAAMAESLKALVAEPVPADAARVAPPAGRSAEGNMTLAEQTAAAPMTAAPTASPQSVRPPPAPPQPAPLQPAPVRASSPGAASPAPMERPLDQPKAVPLTPEVPMVAAPAMDVGPAPTELPATASGVKPAENAADPFSIDAIEMEFARLLGRDPPSKS